MRPPPASLALSEAKRPVSHDSQACKPGDEAARPGPQGVQLSEESARAEDDAVPTGHAMHVQFT